MGLLPSDGDGQGVVLIVVCAIFEAFAIVAVILRLWSVRLKKRSLSANDYLILFALLVSTAIVAIIITAVVAGGLGQHTAQLITQPQALVVFGKTFVAIQPFWVAAITSVKLSILTLYIDLFRSDRFRKVCFAAMAICGLFFMYDILVAFLICHPVGYNWDKTIPGGHCGNEVAAYIAAHTINFIIDASLAILPLPILWKLQMPIKRKVEVSILFGLGILICVISLLRIALWKHLKGTDLTYSVSILYLFTALEPLLGIVLASLPMMRPIGDKMATSSVFSWAKSKLRSPDGSGVESNYPNDQSSNPNVVPRNTKARNFHRLRDDSLLFSKGGGDGEEHLMENMSVNAEHVSQGKSCDTDLNPGVINITQDYDVHSTPGHYKKEEDLSHFEHNI